MVTSINDTIKGNTIKPHARPMNFTKLLEGFLIIHMLGVDPSQCTPRDHIPLRNHIKQLPCML